MEIYAGYLRLSKDDLMKQYSSIVEQKNIITNYYRQHIGYQGEITFFEDDDRTGMNFNREGFQKLEKIIYNKEVKMLVIKDLSRLGRKNWETQMYYEKFVENYDVHIIAINDNHDSKDESSRDIMGIFTWSNERYVRDISKKVTSNIRQKQSRGTHIISIPFGYQLEKDENNNKIIKLDEKTSEIIKLIYNLYTNGNGYRKIASILNDKSYPTPSIYKNKKDANPIWNMQMVRDILRNEFYTGVLLLHKTFKKKIKGQSYKTPENEIMKFEDNHKSIIDKETFDLAQKIMNERNTRKTRGNKNGKIHLFAGKIWCAKCEKSYVYSKKPTGSYYVCGTQHKIGKNYCSNKFINEDKLIEYIHFKILNRISDNKKLLNDMKQMMNNQKQIKDYDIIIKKIKLKIEKKEKSIQQIYVDMISDNSKIPKHILERTLEQLNNELNVLNEQLNKTLEIKNNVKSQEDILRKQNKKLEKFVNKEFTREDIEILIDRIVIDNRKEEFITIYWNI